MPSSELTFESQLAVPPPVAWAWITSRAGIEREMRPWLRMTVPRGFERLDQHTFVPGARLFRRHLFLAECLWIGISDLTLLELTPGVGFVEQSPLTGMKLWRHERSIAPFPSGCIVRDRLTFESYFARGLVTWFVSRFFTRRHAMLRRYIAGEEATKSAQSHLSLRASGRGWVREECCSIQFARINECKAPSPYPLPKGRGKKLPVQIPSKIFENSNACCATLLDVVST